MFTVLLEEVTEQVQTLKWKDDRASLLAYLGSFSQIDFDFLKPIDGEVRIWRSGKSILLKGTVHTVLQLRCGRCLKEFTHPLRSTIDLTLFPTQDISSDEDTELDKEDMEVNFFEGGEIHLSEIACEQVFLEIPFQPLCHEDCKGLCPICGKDRNITTCDCPTEGLESGFSVLRNLKLDQA